MTQFTLRSFFIAVSLSAFVFASTAAHAQNWPDKPVRLIIGYTPGGTVDGWTRMAARRFEERFKQPFVVENKPGANATLATTALAQGPADGTQFSFIAMSTQGRNFQKNVTYDTMKDFEPLAGIYAAPYAFAANAQAPFKTVKDLIDHAKTKRSGWGAANPASLERQAAEQFKAAAKVNAAVVSHEGGGEMMINVLNGTLDMGVGEYQELRAQLAAGKVRVLATFNPERIPKFPEVPTLKELGYNVSLEKFRGIAAPKGLPLDVIKIWETAIPLALADPDFKKIYDAEALIPAFIPHSQYGAFTERFAQNAAAFLKSSGVIK